MGMKHGICDRWSRWPSIDLMSRLRLLDLHFLILFVVGPLTRSSSSSFSILFLLLLRRHQSIISCHVQATTRDFAWFLKVEGRIPLSSLKQKPARWWSDGVWLIVCRLEAVTPVDHVEVAIKKGMGEQIVLIKMRMVSFFRLFFLHVYPSLRFLY